MARKNSKAVKADIERIGKIRTPKGVAAFAYLHKPDDSFGKERYRINVFFPDKNDPEFKTFVKKLKDAKAEHGVKNIPIKLCNEKLSETIDLPVGTPFIECETQYREDKEAPAIFNARGQRDDSLNVFGGDIVRVEATLCTWELPSGSGLKLYLNAVQLLKSNYTGGAGSTFEEEEEYLTEDEEGPENEDNGEGLEDEGESFEDEGDSSEAEDPTDGLL